MPFIAAGNRPVCLRIQANANRVTVFRRGMLTTSLVSQSNQMKCTNQKLQKFNVPGRNESTMK